MNPEKTIKEVKTLHLYEAPEVCEHRYHFFLNRYPQISNQVTNTPLLKDECISYESPFVVTSGIC